PVRVCVAYQADGERFEDVPPHQSLFHRAEPVYEELEGWKETLDGARVLDDLPQAARKYVRFLEDGAGVPLYLVSVGPRRRETIVLHNPFMGRAAAP
ncbi:MAG TPA: adenylosuccinate synthetase, partial [Polyangiaceae bacterium]